MPLKSNVGEKVPYIQEWDFTQDKTGFGSGLGVFKVAKC